MGGGALIYENVILDLEEPRNSLEIWRLAIGIDQKNMTILN